MFHLAYRAFKIIKINLTWWPTFLNQEISYLNNPDFWYLLKKSGDQKIWQGAESRWRHGKMRSSHLPTTRVTAGYWWGTSMPKEMGGTPKRVAGGQAKAPAVGALSANHWTNREPQTPGNIHQSEVSQRSSFQHQDPALPNSLQTPVLEASGQTTSKTETQSHPSKKKKKIWQPWACLPAEQQLVGAE